MPIYLLQGVLPFYSAAIAGIESIKFKGKMKILFAVSGGGEVITVFY